MIKLVLLRHGQSTWNLENRFTGWTDVDLSEKGRDEAEEAGRILQEEGFGFDIVFTSVLKRAIRTLWIVLDVMDLMWLPVHCSWQLNEKHYGALQGKDKKATVEEFGKEQVQLWRRSYDVPAPPLPADRLQAQSEDPRYRGLPSQPATESLLDTQQRVLPYWHEKIMPCLREQKRVLIAAHGNSLRSLVKYLDDIGNEEILALNIPTGIPLVYELDDDLKPIRHYYLGDQEKIQAAIDAVAGQTKTSGR